MKEFLPETTILDQLFCIEGNGITGTLWATCKTTRFSSYMNIKA